MTAARAVTLSEAPSAAYGIAEAKQGYGVRAWEMNGQNHLCPLPEGGLFAYAKRMTEGNILFEHSKAFAPSRKLTKAGAEYPQDMEPAFCEMRRALNTCAEQGWIFWMRNRCSL